MADIKTRDTIKTINKAAVATERMKKAYVITKDKAEHSTNASENSAEEYASDKIETATAKTSIKTTKEAAIIAQKTAKTTAKATQKAVQMAKKVAKAAAKVTVATVKAIIAGTKVLVAAIATGGRILQLYNRKGYRCSLRILLHYRKMNELTG